MLKLLEMLQILFELTIPQSLLKTVHGTIVSFVVQIRTLQWFAIFQNVLGQVKHVQINTT